MQYGSETGEYNIEQRPKCSGLREQFTSTAQGGSYGSDIGVFASGLPAEQSGDNLQRSRNQQETFRD